MPLGYYKSVGQTKNKKNIYNEKIIAIKKCIIRLKL